MTYIFFLCTLNDTTKLSMIYNDEISFIFLPITHLHILLAMIAAALALPTFQCYICNSSITVGKHSGKLRMYI